ncbi:MAG: hypothetical protein IT209_00835 [Armatimonadetes bacterium]|nr:hypothetical protein [Armatimonadota bacterium]
MAYLDVYNLKAGTSGGELKARAQVAMAELAIEALQDGGASEALKDLAKEVLLDTEGYLNRILWPFLTDATIQTKANTASDAEIKTAVTNAIVIFL